MRLRDALKISGPLVFWRLVLAVFGLLWLLFCLLTPAPTERFRSSPLPGDMTASPLPLVPGESHRDGALHFSQGLSGWEGVLATTAVRLRFATYHRSGLALVAIIEDGSGCRFSAAEGVRILDNELFEFRSDRPCRFQKNPRLTLKIVGIKELAVYVRRGVKPDSGPQIDLPDQSKLSLEYLAIESTTISGLARGRLKIIAEVWAGHGPLGWMIVFAACFVFAGLSLVGRTGISRNREILLAGVMYAGLAGTYAVLFPPFHGPDEPDHLLYLAEMNGKSALRVDFLRLAQKTHFERLRFAPGEFLTELDLAKPLSLGWASYITPAGGKERSPLGEIFWRALGWFLPDDAETAVLTARMFGVLLAGVAGAGVVSILGAGSSGLATILLMWAPTLAFFQTVFSNYTIVTFAATLQSAVFLAVLRGRTPDMLLGLTGGVLIAGGILAGHTGLGLAPVWFCLLLGICAGFVIDRDRRHIQSFLRFCLGFAGAALPLLVLLVPAGYLPRLLFVANQAIAWVNAPGIGPAMVIAAVITLVSFYFLHKCLGPQSVRQFCERWFPLMAKVELLVLTVAMLIVTIHPVAPLPDIEANPSYGLVNYVFKCLRVFGSSLGFGPTDGYMGTTFWLGFGWLDSRPPDSLANMLRGFVSAGLWLIWFQAARGRGRRLWLMAHFMLLGIALSLVLLAVGTFPVPANLHGRYLIVFYLPLMALALAGFSGWLDAMKQRRCLGWWGIGLMIMHLYCWQIILGRYYGPY